MIKIYVRLQDCGAAAHCEGARTVHKYTTFEIEAPALEKFLADGNSGFTNASIEGFEIVDEKPVASKSTQTNNSSLCLPTIQTPT